MNRRERWQSEVDRFGYARALHARLMSAAERFLGLHVYYVRSSPFTIRSADVPEGVTIGLIPHDAALAAARDPEMDLPMWVIDHAFARGDWCYGAMADGKVVAYALSSLSGSAPHTDRVWVEFGPDSLYGYSLFVHPDWRGQDLPLWSAELDLPFEPPSSSIGFIATHNHASLRRARRRGTATTVGIAGYLDRFGLFVGFRTPAVKKLGFRFVRVPSDAPGIGARG